MGNKKRIALVAGLILTLIFIFFLQKRIIANFSLKPERLELFFDKNSDLVPLILAEEEYINERYTLEYGDITSIQKPEKNEDEFFKDKFIDYMKLRIPYLNEKELNIIDYSDTIRILTEWHRGSKLIIASLLFILISVTLVRRIKINRINLKDKLKKYYFKEITYQKSGEILEEAIRLVLLIFSGLFLLQWIVMFQFNIPGKYVPVNDIFDFKFYQSLSNPAEIYLSNYGNFYYKTLNKVRLLTLGIFVLDIIALLLILKERDNKTVGGGIKYEKSSI